MKFLILIILSLHRPDAERTKLKRSISNECFAGSNLESISLPSTITSIGRYAFLNSALSSIDLPDGLLTIGDDAFIGSDTQLVAPVEVEAGATIGAGSTIVKTAPADQLTLSRARQLSLKGWKRPKKI